MKKFKILLITLSIFLFSFSYAILKFEKKITILNRENFNESLEKNINKIFPKICEKRVFEVNLSKNLIYFFENCKLKEIMSIAYQAPEGKWYQTPTGYFRIGIKKEKHISSLFPVYMNYAVQMYEDFFIHEIPIYLNGARVTSNFSGGCIRLETENAKKFFKLAQPGDLVISYKELNTNKFKKYFHPPVDLSQFFIRQRFNNPIRVKWENAKNTENRKHDYIQHAGVDLTPNPDAKDLNAYSIFDGKIVKIIKNGEEDHGLGNSVIIEFDNKLCDFEKDLCKKFNKIYALYAHLESINPDLKENLFIKKGEIIGKVGATGYGCNYWRIGDDGCNKTSPLDTHLHLEIKTSPVLESPLPASCFVNGSYKNCYGYTPDNPENYGYINPINFLFQLNK